MKTINIFGILAIAVLPFGWGIAHSLADETANRAPGETAAAITPRVVLTNATKGKVRCTAAINSDGTVARCFKCNPDPLETQRLGLGEYEVAFAGLGCTNITADRGFSRWVQPDTLGILSTDAYCTTADRFLDPTSVFVQCRNAAGLVDTSFFLFIAR